jgi:ABC-type sugar transport system ATPase subunit
MTDARDPEPQAGSLAHVRVPTTPLLEVEKLSKAYGPIQAAAELTLDVKAGEVHGICGHNGAGKSTLVKSLVGLVRPDSGTIRFDGEAIELRDPQDAQSRGIAIVNQELSLVPTLSVEDNIYLGGADVPLRYRRRELSTRARQVLDDLGLERVSLAAPVESLPIGERQLVEIARLLVRDARLLILDEPTATLSKPEIEHVFRATRELVARGHAVIFVSHRLDEVFELCDRVTVLRDGRVVSTHAIREINRRALIGMILGEMEGTEQDPEPQRGAPAADIDAPDVVQISNLNVPGKLKDFTLTLKPGRIVGLAGQIGSGTSTALRALGGLEPSAGGAVKVLGQERLFSSPRRALDAGILYVTNDRQGEGLFLGHRVDANLTASRLKLLSRLGIVRRRAAQSVARELATMVGVRFERLSAPVSALSGGNQQKVLLGRSLRRPGAVVLALDEPTRGVDVGGRADIHQLVREASAEGVAVIFASTELDEVLDLADVIVTMFEGAIVSVLPRDAASAASVLADMTTKELRPGGVAA